MKIPSHSSHQLPTKEEGNSWEEENQFALATMPSAAQPERIEAGRLNQQSLLEMANSYTRYYAAGKGHTARAKRYDLIHFLDFLAAGRPVALLQVSDWTMQSTKDFVDYRLSCGEAPATVARRLATLKHFGRTLAERVPGYINPAREVKSPVFQTGRPQGLSELEVELLRRAGIEECEQRGNSFIGMRNCFLLDLLLATGLRADEVRLLVVSQISEDLSWLKNVKTKGRKFRNVYLDTSVRTKLEQYLVVREAELLQKYPAYADIALAERNRFPVFVSLYHAKLLRPETFGLAPKTVWRIISSIGTRAQGLSQERMPNLHPHILRHTFAHGLLDSSRDVRLVAQALGHSDVRITMRYTERTEEELARAIEKKTARSQR